MSLQSLVELVLPLWMGGLDTVALVTVSWAGYRRFRRERDPVAQLLLSLFV